MSRKRPTATSVKKSYFLKTLMRKWEERKSEVRGQIAEVEKVRG
jgi:hypothetical protein